VAHGVQQLLVALVAEVEDDEDQGHGHQHRRDRDDDGLGGDALEQGDGHARACQG
jgi:hypothetical protein